MEVQSRTAETSRVLSGRAARVWAQRWSLLALATVLTLAALAVDAQPLRSPWWTYADADATYTASALNLMLGEEVTFVDHPGLPITEAVAVASGIDALASERSLSQEARLNYVNRTLLDLDGARGLFRGFAVAFYLLGALLAFVLAARLFGHWSWGLANGLFWFAAPGLIAMSIQLRPDVLLAALCLVFAFAIARAADRRSVGWYAAAALLVGFATMVKLHALALLLPLIVAALWCPPAENERVVVNSSDATNVSVNETLIWIDEALHMPIKSETTSKDGKRVTMELLEISLDVDRSVFQIPGGYEKITILDLARHLKVSE